MKYSSGEEAKASGARLARVKEIRQSLPAIPGGKDNFFAKQFREHTRSASSA